jgi:hypothetical protein
MKVDLINEKGDLTPHSISDAEFLLKLAKTMKARGRKKVFFELPKDSEWKYLNGALMKKAKKKEEK